MLKSFWSNLGIFNPQFDSTNMNSLNQIWDHKFMLTITDSEIQTYKGNWQSHSSNQKNMEETQWRVTQCLNGIFFKKYCLTKTSICYQEIILNTLSPTILLTNIELMFWSEQVKGMVLGLAWDGRRLVMASVVLFFCPIFSFCPPPFYFG